MIKLEKQSLAINAAKVPGPDYQMDQSVKLSKTATPIELINYISSATSNVSEGRLENLVINSHGSPGIVYVSIHKVAVVDPETSKLKKEEKVEYIGIHNVGLFKPVAGKIGTIWFTGCQIGSGSRFCSQLAVTVGCNVVAADVYQYVNPGFYFRLFPKNCIDEYEGVAYKWDVKGNKSVFSRKDWLGFDDTKQHWL